MENILERIKTKPGYKVLLFLAIVVLLSWLNYRSSLYYKVKHNEVTLVCEFKDGWKTIDPNKFTGYIDEENVWTFVNGYSHNCYLEKPNKGEIDE